MNLNDTVAYLSKYATIRNFNVKKHTKKITSSILKEEIIAARILGEMSGAEKLLNAIVDNKDWDRGDIEAELHIYIKDLNNMVCEYLHSNRLLEVDDILKAYNYIEEDNDGK